MKFLQAAQINKAAAIAAKRKSIANWAAGMANAESDRDRAWVQSQIDGLEEDIARIKSEPWSMWN